MKTRLHLPLAVMLLAFSSTTVFSQDIAMADQNPDYRVSRDRYMKNADTLTSLQGTTVHNTYKAIDYYEDKRQAKAEKIAFKRQLKLERAKRQQYSYNNGGYYGPSNYSSPYSQFFWNALPLVITLGYLFSK